MCYLLPCTKQSRNLPCSPVRRSATQTYIRLGLGPIISGCSNFALHHRLLMMITRDTDCARPLLFFLFTFCFPVCVERALNFVRLLSLCAKKGKEKEEESSKTLIFLLSPFPSSSFTTQVIVISEGWRSRCIKHE